MKSAPPIYRPLYQQVREEILERLIDGRWPPGFMLPSEQEIGKELGVSQGTVRKALDGLTADEALVRRQGRGTFVASPGEGQFLFKFFRMADKNGKRHYPTSEFLSCRRKVADRKSIQILKLEKGSGIWEIERIRHVKERPTVWEHIIVPVTRFPDIGSAGPLPNNLYVLFSARYGVTVHHAVERVTAVPANASDHRKLGCGIGTPLLLIDRISFTLDETPLEWRRARCTTDEFHYETQIS